MMTRWIPRLACWLLAFGLTACAARQASLDNDAYIWQRQWTPALVRAVMSQGQHVRAWRVLAGEMDGQGRWHMFTPDWRALAASGKPVIAVVRIEGQLASWDEATLLADVRAVLSVWRQQSRMLEGVEIDHDCATARLPAYTHFLQALHPALLPNEHLSITALPTWLASDGLAALLSQADSSVLQVHAVQSPRAGLFDADRALDWMRAFARHTSRPWSVALPAYGTRVSWDAEGGVSVIESERPMLVGEAGSSELFADPRMMQSFIATLQADAPTGLAGIVWFRLPTEEDARAWSAASWQAVLSRAPLRPRLLAKAVPSDDPHRYDVVLSNEGNADMPLPALIRVDGSCVAADGIHGYALQRSGATMVLQRAQAGSLRAGRQMAAGWLRCDAAPVLRITS